MLLQAQETLLPKHTLQTLAPSQQRKIHYSDYVLVIVSIIPPNTNTHSHAHHHAPETRKEAVLRVWYWWDQADPLKRPENTQSARSTMFIQEFCQNVLEL